MNIVYGLEYIYYWRALKSNEPGVGNHQIKKMNQDGNQPPKRSTVLKQSRPSLFGTKFQLFLEFCLGEMRHASKNSFTKKEKRQAAAKRRMIDAPCLYKESPTQRIGQIPTGYLEYSNFIDCTLHFSIVRCATLTFTARHP
jgi:hypothetical protein